MGAIEGCGDWFRAQEARLRRHADAARRTRFQGPGNKTVFGVSISHYTAPVPIRSIFQPNLFQIKSVPRADVGRSMVAESCVVSCEFLAHGYKS
jgi:hypothetical protein